MKLLLFLVLFSTYAFSQQKAPKKTDMQSMPEGTLVYTERLRPFTSMPPGATYVTCTNVGITQPWQCKVYYPTPKKQEDKK